MDYKSLLLESFDKVIEAAAPQFCLAQYIPEPHQGGKTYVIGAGKAAAKMAQIFEENYQGEYTGSVITRYGFSVPTKTIEVLEASHPNPDESCKVAAKKILSIAEQAQENDLVICLISGGGSSLLSCPHDEIDFEELQDLNDQLLKSGASIHEINTVRKHLNQAFGGKLAAKVYPAKLLTLSISDVAGDDLSTIASGPTVPDPTTLEDAQNILKKYELKAGQSIIDFLNNSDNETLKADDAVFENCEYQLIATPEKSLQVAASYFKGKNITPYILSSELEGDTNECAAFHASLTRRIMDKSEPFPRPCVLLSGGETTVKINGKGQGGPNTQFMLKFAELLEGRQNFHAIACDTDGIDGVADNAGAFIDPTTLSRSEKENLKIKDYLNDNDSYHFFEKLGDLIKTGPTHTNVNDYRAIIIV